MAGSAARNETQGHDSTQRERISKFRFVRPIKAGRPPIDSAQDRESMASSTQSREGVLMVSPRNKASFTRPFSAKRKTFGTGQLGRWLCKRATARGLSAIMP